MDTRCTGPLYECFWETSIANTFNTFTEVEVGRIYVYMCELAVNADDNSNIMREARTSAHGELWQKGY